MLPGQGIAAWRGQHRLRGRHGHSSTGQSAHGPWLPNGSNLSVVQSIGVLWENIGEIAHRLVTPFAAIKADPRCASPLTSNIVTESASCSTWVTVVPVSSSMRSLLMVALQQRLVRIGSVNHCIRVAKALLKRFSRGDKADLVFVQRIVHHHVVGVDRACAHLLAYSERVKRRKAVRFDLQACTTCHGAQGITSNQAYFPRIAGKPAGYLFNQLQNFKEGRRHYGLMVGMVEHLSDACHTARGGVAYAGGKAIATPFGAVYTSNITTDFETGIGNGSADAFYRLT